MLGFQSIYEKSLNGIKTLSDGISTIQNGQAFFNQLTAINTNLTNLFVNDCSMNILTSTTILTDDINCSNLLTVENSYLNDASITNANINDLDVSNAIISNALIDTASIDNLDASNCSLNDLDVTNTTTLNNLNVSNDSNLHNINQTLSSVIYQSGTGINIFKTSQFNSINVLSNLSVNGETEIEDLTTDNITLRSGKSINQSGTINNNLGTTTVTNLTVINSITLPSDVIISGSLYNDDLTMDSSSSIIQDLTGTGKNTFKESDFTKINVNGNINQNSGKTSLKNTTVTKLDISGNLTQTDGQTNLESLNITNDLNVNGNTQLKTLTLNNGSISISNTEFQALDGIASNIQNQFNSGLALINANTTNIATLNANAVFKTNTNQSIDGIKTFVKQTNFNDNITQTSGTATLKAVTCDSLAVGSVACDSLTVGSVNNTEISYLDGVTSSIQNQLNNLSSGQSTLNSNVVFLSGSQTITGNKTFNGTQTFAGITASSLSVGNVSNTEISYLDGVTSSIQNQLTANTNAISANTTSISNNNTNISNNSSSITSLQNSVVYKTSDQVIGGIKTFTSALYATAQLYGNLIYCNALSVTGTLSVAGTISSASIVNTNDISTNSLSCQSITTSGGITSSSHATDSLVVSGLLETNNLSVDSLATLNTVTSNNITTDSLAVSTFYNNESIQIAQNEIVSASNTKTLGLTNISATTIVISPFFKKNVVFNCPISVYRNALSSIGGTTNNYVENLLGVTAKLYLGGVYQSTLTVTSNNAFPIQKWFQNTIITPFSYEQYVTNVSCQFIPNYTSATQTYEIKFDISYNSGSASNTTYAFGYYVNTNISTESLSNANKVSNASMNYSVSSVTANYVGVTFSGSGTLYANDVINNLSIVSDLYTNNQINNNSYLSNIYSNSSFININAHLKQPYGYSTVAQTYPCGYFLNATIVSNQIGNDWEQYDIICSNRRLQRIDSDNLWVVMPGYIFTVYDTIDYGGTYFDFDNSTGLVPITFRTSDYFGVSDRVGSVRVYYLSKSNQITLFIIS